jgi:hypothetical protein
MGDRLLDRKIFKADTKVLSKVFLFTIAALLIPLPLCAELDKELRQSSSFRCGDALISLDDTAADVMIRCGKPLRRVVSARGDFSKGRSTPQRLDAPKKVKAGSDLKASAKKARRKGAMRETWYYDLGPHDFIYSLFFEEGILKKIERGGRGKDR